MYILQVDQLVDYGNHTSDKNVNNSMYYQSNDIDSKIA